MGQRDLTAHTAAWIETDNDTSGGTAEAIHAGESGKKHYVLGIAVSGTTGVDPNEEIAVSLKDDSTVKLLVDAITTGRAGVSGGATPFSGVQPFVITFDDPIEITSGNPCSVEADPSSTSSDRICANIWGFTLDG